MRPKRPLSAGKLIAACGAALALSACEPGFLERSSRDTDVAPPADHAATCASQLADYVELLQKLLDSPQATQAQIATTTQREYELAPTPAHQLRLALVLATPGQSVMDQPRARQLLHDLLATPQSLLPPERAFAAVELQKVEQQLALAAENKRLLEMSAREDHEKLAAINKRLQTETDENARLRKELDEARAKLDAIANIESTVNQRKPNPEGHSP